MGPKRAAAAATHSSPKGKKQRLTTSRAFEWIGKPIRVCDEKVYYGAVSVEDETFKVGDFAQFAVGFRSGKLREHSAWVAQIDALWEDEYKEMWASCRWAYFPEETGVGRLPGQHEREVLLTDHTDHNTVDTISGRAAVLSEAEFAAREAKQPLFWRGSSGSSSSVAAEDDDTADEEAWDAEVELDRATYVAKSFYDYATRQIRPILKRRGGSGAVREVLAPAAAAAQSAGPVRPRNPPSLPTSQSGAGSSSSSSSSSASAAKASFPELCRQAQSMLQLSAVPATLPCREKEREQVHHFLEAAIKKGGLGSALYISGMPGTGKTATVYEVIRSLTAKYERGELPSFEFHEINAMRLASPYQAYSVMLKAVTGITAAPKRAAELLDSHFNKPSTSKKCNVILVDELDFLVTRKESVLYNLFDWPTRRHARLIVIGIANTMDLPERLLPKVHSRLGMGRIVFKPYTKDQITTIVTARLEDLPAFDKDAIRMAAAKVAQISGDVRRALQLCRRAAEIAAQRVVSAASSSSSSSSGALAVKIEDINAAAKALSGGLFTQALAFTSPWQRLILVSIAAHMRNNLTEDAPFGAVYERLQAMGPQLPALPVTPPAAGPPDGTENAAEFFSGYRSPPSLDTALSVCMGMHTSRLVVMESLPGARLPRVRLNFQADDLLLALRDDALVKYFLVDR